MQATEQESSDSVVLGLMRRQGSACVSDLVAETGVTATAVRQRLSRLMAEGLVVRKTFRAGRGRPSHRYSLSTKGVRAAGTNYPDLAVAMWNEIRAIKDTEIRRGLLARLAKQLADQYRSKIVGETLSERMASVASLFCDQGIPWEFKLGASDSDNELEAEKSTEILPVLSAYACPYPDIAEMDRSICAVEKMLLSDLLGSDVRLTDCRLDEGQCCSFVGAVS